MSDEQVDFVHVALQDELVIIEVKRMPECKDEEMELMHAITVAYHAALAGSQKQVLLFIVPISFCAAYAKIAMRTLRWMLTMHDVAAAHFKGVAIALDLSPMAKSIINWVTSQFASVRPHKMFAVPPQPSGVLPGEQRRQLIADVEAWSSDLDDAQGPRALLPGTVARITALIDDWEDDIALASATAEDCPSLQDMPDFV